MAHAGLQHDKLCNDTRQQCYDIFWESTGGGALAEHAPFFSELDSYVCALHSSPPQRLWS